MALTPFSPEEPKLTAAGMVQPHERGTAHERVKVGRQSQVNQASSCAETVAPEITGALKSVVAETSEASVVEVLDDLSSMLARTFEELSVIHELARAPYLNSERSASCVAALERLSTCLPVTTLVLFLPPEGRSLSIQEFFALAEVVQVGDTVRGVDLRCAGSTLFDGGRAVISHALVDLPTYAHGVMVSLCEEDPASGQLLALSREQDGEPGSIEVNMMQSVAGILHAQLETQRQFSTVHRMFEGTVRALVSVIEAKDPYTCGHSSRVAELAASLAADYGLSQSECETIRMCGMLHDIGKIGISDEVLAKPGRLNPREFAMMKRHPELGHQMLQDVPQFSDILPGVLHHHEAWNGTGYPSGLAGEEIPLIARILSVADAFDAMTSTRPYRRGMPLDEVIEIFIDGCGTQWDPNVVSILLENEERMRAFVLLGHN